MQFNLQKSGNTMELLRIYELTIKYGKFQRGQISKAIRIQEHIAEGRWYGEIKRTKKYGEDYDWKTKLNTLVLKQMLIGDRSLALVQDCISIFQKANDSQKYNLILQRISDKHTAPVSPPCTEELKEEIQDFKEFSNFLELFEE